MDGLAEAMDGGKKAVINVQMPARLALFGRVKMCK